MKKQFEKCVYTALACVLAAVLFAGCPEEPIVNPDGPLVDTETPISISVSAGKTDYALGDSLDLASLTVIATYEDNSTKDVSADIQATDIKGFDSAAQGSKTVTVTYMEKSASFTVMVTPGGKTLSGIAVTTVPTRTEYGRGDKLDLTGMVLTLTYSDSSTGTEPVSTDAGIITNYDFNVNKAETRIVTLSYGGKTATFSITGIFHPTLKINTKGQRVVHTMWGEPEEDPRQVIGYELEDGTKYFDHYVMLYGIRLRDRDCSAESDNQCNRKGPHFCFGDNIQNYYFDKYDTYIKPVRDAGIKVILSIVPQDGGMCVGTLYRWPMEGITGAEWSPYPYGQTAVNTLLDQLKELYDKCPFDGIGYDEEYGGDKSTNITGKVYPSDWPGAGDTQWKIGSENIMRFAHQAEQKLGVNLIQEVYEHRYGDHLMPEKITVDGVDVYRDQLFDYAYEAFYGSWQRSSHFGLPNSKFGPASIAICDTGSAPQPKPGRNGIISTMENHLKGNYGVVMYYCLRSREEMKERFPNIYGANNAPPETYFSQISQTLHGQNTVYKGQDYARVWW